MQIVSDADRLLGDLSNSITRQTGFDAVMRVRASTGTEHMCTACDVLVYAAFATTCTYVN